MTSLSACRWICLLSLTAMTLFSASQVDSTILSPSCCAGGRSKEIRDIQLCFEQKWRTNCRHHAFVIITSSNEKICVKRTSPWLKKRLNRGELNCPPVLLMTGFGFLDEDDVE